MVVSTWIDALVGWAKLLSLEWYLWLKWIINQVITIVCVLLVILWVAVFMYGSFYYSYMPSVSHIRDVHLQFRTDCDSDNRLCSFPASNLSLIKGSQTELLMRGQDYVVVLEMELPESPVNQNLGMFMVSISFFAKHGEVVASSLRSSMLRFKSPLYHALETFFYLPTLLLGSEEQKQKISVELFDNYQEDPYKPAVGAYVEVQNKRIEIYRSSLHIHARFSGLRYLLFTYPTTAAVFGIGTNMFFLVVMFLASWQRFLPEEKPTKARAKKSLNLQERKNRVKARMERERQAKRALDESVPEDLSAVDLSSLMTESKAGQRPDLVTEAVLDPGIFGDKDSDEEIIHTSSLKEEDLTEGLRQRTMPKT